MSTAKLLIKNTAILTTGEVLSRILSFFLIIIIARHLGDEGLGKYSFAFAFVVIFSLLSDFGISTFMTREIAKNKGLAQKIFSNALSVKILLGAFSALIPVLVIYFLDKVIDVKAAVFFAALASLLNYVTLTFRCVINAYEVQIYQSIYIITERVVAFLLALIFIWQGYGLVAICSVFAISNFIALFVVSILVDRKIKKVKLEFDFGFIKWMLAKSMPFWFTVIFITIYFKIDTVMLTFMRGYEETGWYNASYKIIDALFFIPTTVITIVFPAMSKFHLKSQKTLSLLYEKSFYYLFALALPIAIGTSILSSRIIGFVYKNEFTNSVVALNILIWVIVLTFVNYLMGFLLNSIEKQKLFTLTTGLTAVFNIILNFILIPYYGFVGAAIATIASEAINFLLLYYFTSKSGFKIDLLVLAIKPIIAGLIMLLVLYNLAFLHIFIIIPVSAALYFAALIIIGGIYKDDLGLLKSLVKK
jgi:O-antigen/teichoic acid export membrane protein